MEESELIDRYLKGELDQEKSERFINRLASDTELQQKVALRKFVIAGIAAAYAEELKSKLADVDRTMENKNRFLFSWKMTAAFAAIVITASVLYFIIQKPDPYEFDLVEAGLPNEMGSASKIALNNAMSIFKAGDYEASGKAFHELLIHSPNNDTLLYFSGLCNFRNKHPESAIEKWKGIETESVYYSKAVYRMGIAHWALGDLNTANELLQQAKQSDNVLLKQQSEKALHRLQ